MADGNVLSLRWNNHLSNFKYTLDNLRQKNIFSDAMIACEGRVFPVHKFVLATCSDYFSSIFEKIPCKHPVIILKDINPYEIDCLLSYMYGGEVQVNQTDLPGLIRAAELLHVKGLAAADIPPSGYPEEMEVKEGRMCKRKREDKGDFSFMGDSSVKDELDDEYSLNMDSKDASTDRESVTHFFTTYQELPAQNSLKATSSYKLTDTELKAENEASEPVPEILSKENNPHPEPFDTVPDMWGNTLLKQDGESWRPLSNSTQAVVGEKKYEIEGVTTQNIQTTLSTNAQVICYCPMCDYATHNRSWLNIHMRKHTGEKPYSCPYCPFRSAQKGNLNVHVRKIHSALQSTFTREVSDASKS